MRNRSVRDSTPPPRHHSHYGHHHMGEGETSAAEKEKTGHHAWVSHLLDAAEARYAILWLLIDTHHVSGGRTYEGGSGVPQTRHAASAHLSYMQ